MANVFDQFDAAPKKSSGNIFDQFDAKESGASDVAAAPREPSLMDRVGDTMNTLRDWALGGYGSGEPSGSVLDRVSPAPQEPAYDAAELTRLSNRKYAQGESMPQKVDSMTEAKGKLIPLRDDGILSRGGAVIGSSMDRYAGGLGSVASDLAKSVGANDVADILAGKANALNDRANTAQLSVALSAQDSYEKYIPQILGQAPQLAMAASGLGLPAIFVTSAVSKYGELRAAGNSEDEALLLALPNGAAETLGEKLGGTGKLAKAFESLIASPTKTAALGVAKAAAGNMVKEVPSEELTYAMQFGLDKLPTYGSNRGAGVGEFMEGAKDTAIVAAGTGGMAGSVAVGATQASKYLPTPSPESQLADALNQDIASTSFTQRGVDADAIVSMSADRSAASERLRRGVAIADIGSAPTVDDATTAFTEATRATTGTGTSPAVGGDIAPAGEGSGYASSVGLGAESGAAIAPVLGEPSQQPSVTSAPLKTKSYAADPIFDAVSTQPLPQSQVPSAQLGEQNAGAQGTAATNVGSGEALLEQQRGVPSSERGAYGVSAKATFDAAREGWKQTLISRGKSESEAQAEAGKHYPEISDADLPAEHHQRAESLAGMIGEVTGIPRERIHFINDSNAGNGMSFRGADGQQHTLVNFSGNLSVTHTGWHEVNHTLKAVAASDDKSGLSDTPAQRYRDRIDNLLGEFTRDGKREYVSKFLYKDEMSAAEKKARIYGAGKGLTGADLEKHVTRELNKEADRLGNTAHSLEEMQSDLVGKLMDDKDFVQRLAKADPIGFKRFAQKWAEFLSDMLTKAKSLLGAGGNSQSKKVDQYVQDLERAKQIVESAMLSLREKTKMTENADGTVTFHGDAEVLRDSLKGAGISGVVVSKKNGTATVSKSEAATAKDMYDSGVMHSMRDNELGAFDVDSYEDYSDQPLSFNDMPDDKELEWGRFGSRNGAGVRVMSSTKHGYQIENDNEGYFRAVDSDGDVISEEYSLEDAQRQATNHYNENRSIQDQMRRERERLQRENDENARRNNIVRSITKPTEEKLKKAGATAESAYEFGEVTTDADGDVIIDMPIFLSGNYRIQTGSNGKYYVNTSIYDYVESASFNTFVPSSDPSLQMTKDGSVAYVKRLIAGNHLAGNGFDLASIYRKATIQKIADKWKQLAKAENMFKFGSKQTAKTGFAEVAAEMGVQFSGYTIDDRGSDIAFRRQSDGRMFSASINEWAKQDSIEVCTMGLAGSDLGTGFYAVMGQVAKNRKKGFYADSTLSTVNAYRRTEQAFSFALKTGDTGVVFTGPQNRVHGYNFKPKTQLDHDTNLARLALANYRNVKELIPEIDRWTYNPATDTFTDKQGRSVEDKVDAAIGNKSKRVTGDADVRALGIGRSTLARAALTRMIINDDPIVDSVESFDKPVAYSKRDNGETMLGENYGDPAENGSDILLNPEFESISEGEPLTQNGERTEAFYKVQAASIAKMRGADVQEAVEFVKKEYDYEAALEKKFERLNRFHKERGPIVDKIHEDARNGKEEAAIMRLITRLGFRIGGEGMTDGKPTFGASTLLPEHITINGDHVTFDFRGKSGVQQRHEIIDAEIARDLEKRIGNGRLFTKGDRAVRRYHDSIIGDADYKVHDHRTWVATDAARRVVEELPQPENIKELRAGIELAGSVAATKIGDDLDTALKSYVDPSIFSGWKEALGLNTSRVRAGTEGSGAQGDATGDTRAAAGEDESPVRESKRQQVATSPAIPAAQQDTTAENAVAGIKDETKWEKFRRTQQDSQVRWDVIQRQLIESGGNIDVLSDVYGAMKRYPGRVGDSIERFTKEQVEPLMDRAAKLKVDLSEIGTYLYALHAPDRNAYIASKRADMPDGGSGMTNAEAAQVVSDYRKRSDFSEFDQLSQDFQRLSDLKQQILMDYGVLDQDQVDAMRAAMGGSYVPLKGFEKVDTDGNTVKSTGSGQGYSTSKRVDKRAYGRLSKAGNIVENIVRDVERAILLGEKTHVGKFVRRLAETNPDPSLWTVNQVPKRPQMHSNGQVVMMPDQYDPEKEIQFIENGEVVRIQLRDPLMARAYNNLSGTEMHAVLQHMSAVNQLLRQFWTQKNPAFFLINPIRDIQTATIINMGEGGAGFSMKALGNLRQAFKASYAKERGKTGDLSPEWAAILDAYSASGARTGAAWIDTIEAKTMKLEEIMNRKGGMSVVDAWRKFGFKNAASLALYKSYNNAFFDWVEHLNGGFENMTRLATFKAYVDQHGGLANLSGKQRATVLAEAAKLAKNVTVDFNTKGEMGRDLNAAYLFWNANVQGTANIGRAVLSSKHKSQVHAALASLVAAGLMLSMFTDDDDEDLTPEYMEQRNAVFHLGGMRYMIPMAYGFSAFVDIGRHIGNVIKGRETTMKAAKNIVSSFMANFFPLGDLYKAGNADAADVFISLAPTIAKPSAMTATNRNSFGGKLVPEYDGQESVPDREKMYRGTRDSVYDTISNKMIPWADVSPETIKNLVGYVLGGVGRTGGDAASTVSLAADGRFDIEKTPIANKFVGVNDVEEYRSRFYQQNQEIKSSNDAVAYLKKKAKTAPAGDRARIFEEIAKMRSEHPEMALAKQMAAYSSRMAKLADQAIEARRSDDTAKLESIEAQMITTAKIADIQVKAYRKRKTVAAEE